MSNSNCNFAKIPQSHSITLVLVPILTVWLLFKLQLIFVYICYHITSMKVLSHKSNILVPNNRTK